MANAPRWDDAAPESDAPAASAASKEAKKSTAAENGEEKKDDKKKKKKDEPIRIDLDGIANRLLPFPVPEGRYGRIAGAPGKAIFTILPIKGSQEDEEDDEEDGSGSDGLLQAWNFKEFRADTLVQGVQSVGLSRNRKKML